MFNYHVLLRYSPEEFFTRRTELLYGLELGPTTSKLSIIKGIKHILRQRLLVLFKWFGTTGINVNFHLVSSIKTIFTTDRLKMSYNLKDIHPDN